MSLYVPTFLINLDYGARRCEALERQLDALGLPHQHSPGAYGRILPVDELACHYDHAHTTNQGRELTAGEVNCALSHLGVYRAMIEQNLLYALILEDDIKLGSDVPAVLNALAQSVSPSEPAVTLFIHIDRYYRRNARPLTADHRTIKLANYQWLAHGYFVTRAAAKYMVEQLYPVWLTTDYWYKFKRKGIVQIRAVVPYVIGVQDFDNGSNLEADRAIESREVNDCLGFGHHLRRIFMRRSLYRIFIRPFLGIVRQKKT